MIMAEIADQRRVLVVEDDSNLALALADKLSSRGFVVEVAANGEEALAKLRSLSPDILLLDILMPVMSGFKVMEAMQADEKLSSVPVLILSNLDQEADILRAKKSGAVDYLVKSNVKLKEVVARVEDILAEK